MIPLSQERGLQGHQNFSSKPLTMCISSEKVWNDVQEGVHVFHSAVPQRRALLVRLIILCFCQASSEVSVYDSRLKTKKQEVQNGPESSRIPSYFSRVPTQGFEIILGCGKARAGGSRVGNSNEGGQVDASCCNCANRVAKVLATAAHLVCAASSSISYLCCLSTL